MDPKATTSTDATVKRALLAVKTLQAKVQELERARTEPIAVVGVGCRFPSADGPDEFWRLLASGVDAVGEIPLERWDCAAFFDPDPDAPGKMSSKWGAFLRGVDQFDADFFGISPREAAALDPQQRLFLEVAWEALEHAGQAPDQLLGRRAGVFLGISTLDYLHVQNVGGLSHISAFTGTGNAFSTAAGRVSYTLGLQGPSLAVDTACSSSLVCVHLACQSLRLRECDLALAGGVNLMLSPATSIAVSKYHALSPDGRCKAFDAAANGFVRGEGCGVVVLKRLSDALANRDHVLGLIRGSAVNQDGRSAGLTAPNALAQQAVLLAALERAGVSAGDVSYIEAHGTGTSLGDPIEVAALSEVYGATNTPVKRALASVKTNLGHLEAAAGVAGLIKVLLALGHEEIPAHLHFRKLNPSITFAGTAFYVPTERVAWPRQEKARFAAVSSFGISGTNAHAVIEEAPSAEASAPVPERSAHVFTLSARSESALRELARRYERHLAERRASISDVCFTVNGGRARFGHRLALVTRSLDQLREQLARVHQEYAPAAALRASVTRITEPRIAFLFSGQGAQSPGMGFELYQSEPVFRRCIERCDALLRGSLGASLIELLYPGGAESATDSTRFAAVTTFAIQHALVELWRSWGITPQVVVGHSVGEYAAAWAAGVLSLEDALTLVAERSRLIASVSTPGAMAVVHAAREPVEKVIAGYPDLAIAAFNGPSNLVLSGPTESLGLAMNELQRAGFVTNRLKAAHAFHSSLLDAILDPFESVTARVSLRLPAVTYISGATGKIVAQELVESGYWRRHLREAVHFADAVRTLRAERCDAFIEIGPSPVLLALAEPELRKARGQAVFVPSLSKKPADEQMARSVSQLFLAGIEIDWAALDRDRDRRRIPLPTYPFERKPYWFDGRAQFAPAAAEGEINPLLGRPVPIALDHRVFESDFSAATLPFLADHRVYERLVVPAAAYVALALMAGGEVLDTARPVCERVVFEEPLILPPAGRVRVQILLSPEGPGRYRFRIASLDQSSAGSWRQHAVGQLSAAAGETLPGADFEALRARLREPYSVERYYSELREVGIDLGPQFQGILELSRSETEALGQLRPPEDALALGCKYLHPVLIDSCFQLLGAILASTTDERQIYLPMSVERVELCGVPRGKLCGYAALSPRRSREVLEGSVGLYDEGGATVMSAVGLLAHLAPRELFFRNAQGPAKYEIAWGLRLRASSTALSERSGRWLIFSAQGELARRLGGELRERGCSCIDVVCGALAVSPERVTLEPSDPAHYRELLAAVTADGAAIAGIVLLWGVDGASGTAKPPLAAQRLTCEPLLLLLQALNQRVTLGKTLPTVTLVTCGAAATGEGPTLAGLGQAAAWGLRRVAALESPHLDLATIDIDPDVAVEETACALAAELMSADREREIAYRGGECLAPRIVPCALARGAAEPKFTAGGTYLVTGGLGALGLELARWLVLHGARALVLAGRSPASATALEVIEALRAQGALITVVSTDVSAPEGVGRALGAVSPALPLRGVFHLAGVLDDALLDNQRWEGFERVFAPKIAGAWHLHTATRELDLECFVLFSSLASVLGSAGQANYAAANAVLDALAHHRRRQGLAALSVNFGPWAVAGMAAANEVEQRRRAAGGVAPLEPSQALTALGELMSAGVAQGVIADVDWARLAALAAGAYSRTFLNEVLPRFASRAVAPSASAASDLLRRVQAAAPDGRRKVLANHVQAEVAAVLGLDRLSAAQIPISFAELGMNSLMAVELRNRLEASVGRQLPTVAIFNYPTVEALTDYIAQALGITTDTSGPPAAAGDSVSAAAARISELSDAEVEALLLQTIEQIQ